MTKLRFEAEGYGKTLSVQRALENGTVGSSRKSAEDLALGAHHELDAPFASTGRGASGSGPMLAA